MPFPSAKPDDRLFSPPSRLHGERNEASVLFDADAMQAPPQRAGRPAHTDDRPEHSAVIDLDALPRSRVLQRPSIGSLPSQGPSRLAAPRVVPGGLPLHPARRSAPAAGSRALAVAGALGFIGVALAAALLLPM